MAASSSASPSDILDSLEVDSNGGADVLDGTLGSPPSSSRNGGSSWLPMLSIGSNDQDAAAADPDYFYGAGFLSRRGITHSLFEFLPWTQRTAVASWRETLQYQAGGALMGVDAKDGLPEWAPSPTDILANFESLQSNSILDTALSNSLLSPPERYRFLSTTPVGGVLAVVRVWQHDPAAGGSWTQPMLTVLGMPSVVERGTPVVAQDVWPNSNNSVKRTLAPSHLPRPDGPILPVAMTLACDTRYSRNGEVRNQTDYIHDPTTVYCLGGLQALEVGTVLSTIPNTDRPAIGALANLWDTQEHLHAMQTSEQAGFSTSAPRGSDCCVLPKILFLPEIHDLPVGQMWDPAVGLERFLHSLQTMAGPSDPSPATWFQGPLLREWFTQVASNADGFAIDVVPRSSIAASLVEETTMVADVVSHPSPQLQYLDHLLAYRLHRDWILASQETRRLRVVFQNYEHSAWVGSFPADGHMGGSPAALCGDMWFLRPPGTQAWEESLQLESFLQPSAVSPAFRTCVIHRIIPYEPAPHLALEMGDVSGDQQAAIQVATTAASVSSTLQSGASERRTLSASMISHRFLQQYVEECMTDIPLTPRFRFDPTQSHKPFDMEAEPRSHDGMLHRYGRQIIMGLVLAGAATFGLVFSTFGSEFDFHDRDAQPLFFSIVQWLCMSITFPHWIPTVLSIFVSEPAHKFTRSDTPISLRWITRGDDNSKVTVIGVEAGNKVLRDQGLSNFRMEIVTDAYVSVEQYTHDGEVKMRYDPRKGTDVPDKKRVKAPLLIAQEQLFLPDYVNLVVVPDKFKTRCGTEKKGKALYYASLWNKVVRSRQEFGDKVDHIVALCNTGSIARARYKAASLHDEANELREELVLDLGEKSYYTGRRANREIQSLEEVLDGRMLELSTHLEKLPAKVAKVFADEAQDADLLTTAIAELQSWSLQVPLLPNEEAEYDFVKLDSLVFHLDEESIVTPEILWSLNENSTKGELTWRLAQGHHTYADTFNTQGLSCAGFQARMAQFWDAIRSADDGHRWATQLKMLQRILMGAKGSNNKQSQAVEQKRGYSFNGGEATNITEDACQAFTITPAIKFFRREIEAELERLANHYCQTSVIRSYESETTANGSVSVGATSRQSLSLRVDMDAWLADVVFDLRDIAKTRGASLLLAPGIDKAERKLQEKLLELQQLSVAERKVLILEIVKKLLVYIDRAHRDWLGWNDAHWLTGKVREQSPFSYLDFMLQRRRWFTGLLALWREHKYIGKNGHYMIRWGIFGIVMLGWALMPISLGALIISMISSFALDTAADPVTGVVATSLGVTYMYLYAYGSYHQFKRSVSQKLMAFLCWITCLTQITSWLAEAPTGALATFAPDLSFVVVPKDRAIADIVSEDELYPDAMKNLLAQESFQQEVSVAYEGYRSAAIKAGTTISPLSREEFLDALPKLHWSSQA